MSTAAKLRVLCLHGYAQNGETLRGRIAAFRRAFKSSVDFGALPYIVVLCFWLVEGAVLTACV